MGLRRSAFQKRRVVERVLHREEGDYLEVTGAGVGKCVGYVGRNHQRVLRAHYPDVVPQPGLGRAHQDDDELVGLVGVQGRARLHSHEAVVGDAAARRAVALSRDIPLAIVGPLGRFGGVVVVDNRHFSYLLTELS